MVTSTSLSASNLKFESETLKHGRRSSLPYIKSTTLKRRSSERRTTLPDIFEESLQNVSIDESGYFESNSFPNKSTSPQEARSLSGSVDNLRKKFGRKQSFLDVRPNRVGILGNVTPQKILILLVASLFVSALIFFFCNHEESRRTDENCKKAC